MTPAVKPNQRNAWLRPSTIIASLTFASAILGASIEIGWRISKGYTDMSLKVHATESAHAGTKTELPSLRTAIDENRKSISNLQTAQATIIANQENQLKMLEKIDGKISK